MREENQVWMVILDLMVSQVHLEQMVKPVHPDVMALVENLVREESQEALVSLDLVESPALVSRHILCFNSKRCRL